MNFRILAMANRMVSFVVIAWCAGCGGGKNDHAPPADSSKNFSARKRARHVQPLQPTEEIPSNISETSTQSLVVATQAQVAATQSLDSFRRRLQEITGKELLSDTDLKAKAEAGDVEAQSELAKKLFSEGNTPEGFKWQQKSAEQGRAMSQYGMAVCYAKGYGVEPNPAEAVKWFAKAAEQGHPDAQASLAKRYATGDGVAEDKIEAYKWYDIADRKGRYHGNNPRDKLAETMTSAEIAEAQVRSAAFIPKSSLPGR
ncbi:MAG: tetratricopeptide repeat protein [Limisphaerales bacterium]